MRLVSARDWARCGGAIGRPGRRAVSVTAAAAGLLLAAGCQLPFTSSSAAGPTGSGTVTVVAPTEVADAPLFIGINDGLFRQAGLTVHVIPATSVQAEVTALRLDLSPGYRGKPAGSGAGGGTNMAPLPRRRFGRAQHTARLRG